jgi:hypothetical protein
MRGREREGGSLGVVIVVVETLTSFDIPKFHNFIVASGESRLGVGTEHSWANPVAVPNKWTLKFARGELPDLHREVRRERERRQGEEVSWPWRACHWIL